MAQQQQTKTRSQVGAKALPQRVSKLDAAERQFVAAARLFFNNGDAIAVHTLAGASAEILESLCTKAGIDPFSSSVVSANPAITKKDYYRLRNQYRNFFKHADEPPEEINDFSDEQNDVVLFICSHDLALLGRMPPEMQTLTVWYPAMQPFKLADKKWKPILDHLFPQLTSLPRHRQKKLGLELLDWIHSELGALGKVPWLGEHHSKSTIKG